MPRGELLLEVSSLGRGFLAAGDLPRVLGGVFLIQNVKKDSGDCTTVATQPRQLHYSNNLSKKKSIPLKFGRPCVQNPSSDR